MILGLSGFKGVGKDTIGQILVEDFGFKRLAFADKLKEGAAALFGIPYHWVDEFKEENMRGYVALHGGDPDNLGSTTKRSMSWREFLQRFGTEMGREVFGEDFWVDQVLPLGHGLHYHYKTDNIVVTDCRFLNEFDRIHALGGKLVRIERIGYESDGHSSEVSPPEELVDSWIHNNGTLSQLRLSVHDLMGMMGLT